MNQAQKKQAQRGFSLVLTMLIVVLMTLLVVGAIAFTGSERSASVLRTRSERQSACLQAARNRFLSKISVIAGNIEATTFDETLPVAPGETIRLRTGHYTGASATLKAVERLTGDQLTGSSDKTRDITNVVGGGGGLRAAYYRITASCQEAAGPEQEVEFVVRVGI